ncbi:MAG: tyrosine-type recombinase/integrase [Phycisphaeraceae bacterium]|nr:tyrosine-type recombinase/integrase [Phycisphaeraceae bacterium]
MAQTAPIRLVTEDKAEPLRFTFTMKALYRLQARDDRLWAYDTETPGLAVMVTPSGHRAYYWTRRVEGRARKMKLGNVGEVTLDQARRQVDKLNGQRAAGQNPADQRQEARGAMTFGDMFTAYLEKWAKARKRTWRDDEANYTRHLKQWAGRRPDQIKRHDIEALHLRIGKTSPVMANRILALLSKVFSFARVEPNPCRGVQRYKEQSRARFMGADELPHFLKAVEGEPNESLRDFLKLLLFTGQRRRNVASMTWAEVDLRRKVWTIPANKFKSGAAMEVPLVSAAMVILEARKQANAERDTPSDYVFPTDKPGAKLPYMDEPRKAFARVCKAAEITGLTLHDIRRTVGTAATTAGVPYPLVCAMLGHSVEGVTGVYARPTAEAVRLAFDTTVGAMLGKTQKQPTKKARAK